MNGNSNGWEAQLRKGCLEMAILATLWGSRRYGLEILRALAENGNMEIAEGTLYPILARLKGEGLLESEWVEAEAGHPRKYYRLTRSGRSRTKELVQLWNGFSGNLSALVRPVLAGDER